MINCYNGRFSGKGEVLFSFSVCIFSLLEWDWDYGRVYSSVI